MNLGLLGKTAIVTGGSRGIGFATAKQLVIEGANVVICGRQEDTLMEAANKIDKEMLRIPNELYKDNKLNKLSIVLNDSDVTKGYGYGYGYGYGAKVETKPLWKRILGIK